MKPNQLNSINEQMLLKTVCNYKRLVSSSKEPVNSFNGILLKLKKRKAKFKVGDSIRLSKYRIMFDKGYTPNWTTEIFKTTKILYNTDPITYLISNYRNDDIKGCVYAEELQRVMQPNVYLVETIIKRKKGKAYIKWLGFGPEHDKWVPEKDII